MTDKPLNLLGLTVILSNLISNAPAVLLIQSLIPKTDTEAWLFFTAVSTLAENLILLSSAANLMVTEVTGKAGDTLTFKQHLQFGLPLTFLTLDLIRTEALP
ncbi:hypothetical protein IQ270_07875 [Microcoleus sp. LEGE 07076]|uniref:hypothetical protein n=1 Tax=Microcoleus sp. LEGE 07076 TaxID=915322 RepID=UPI0018826330|nr:hypothetical protein [Microcoleus sp. LEGE 07076]MBE9184640.1 hypothetical protein [Microcoleus sp. LEGE 07076]